MEPMEPPLNPPLPIPLQARGRVWWITIESVVQRRDRSQVPLSRCEFRQLSSSTTNVVDRCVLCHSEVGTGINKKIRLLNGRTCGKVKECLDRFDCCV